MASKPTAPGSAGGAPQGTSTTQAVVPEGILPSASEGEWDAITSCPPLPPPHEVRGIQATVRGFAVDGDMEVLQIDVPLTSPPVDLGADGKRALVTLDGQLPGAASFAVLDLNATHLAGIAERKDAPQGVGRTATVFVRRPRAEHALPIQATLLLPPAQAASNEGTQTAAQILHFSTANGPTSAPEPRVLERWARAFAFEMNYREQGGRSPHWESFATRTSAWEQFAGARVIERYLQKKGGRARPVYSSGRESGGDSFLDETFDVVSGAISIYGALRQRETLDVATRKPSRAVPFATVKPPPLVKHPFDQMLAELGTEPPTEVLAQAAPAEFWYLRARELASLFEVTDSVETIGSPVARLVDDASANRGVIGRYETALGLKRSELSKLLGPSLVSSVALVGSDVYLKEGTDLTVLFELKSTSGFRNALGLMTALGAKEHGGVEVTLSAIDGVEVTLAQSKDKAIHQLAATVGSMGLVSNSPGAIARVIATLNGKHESLSREADFRYLLARDASTKADVLVYLSDKFIDEVAGPRQRILESRRVRAHAELLTPGLAAMLFGHLEGRSPTSTRELLASGVLRKKELVHSDGAVIDFEPGLAPHSVYGSPESLVPLIDLSTPKTVTREEAEAYERWSEKYARAWSGYVDPAALRLSFADDKTRMVTAELRVLPLMVSREYGEALEIVGSARVTAEPLSDGLRLLLALSRDARWRRELNRTFSPETFVKGLSLDILGDWVMTGANDTAALSKALRHSVLDAEFCGKRSARDSSRELAKVPFFAGIGIANYTGAAIALTALRELASSTLGDDFRWEQIGKERDVPVAQIQVGVPHGERAANGQQEPEFTGYLALLKDALYVAQSESTLRGLVRDHLDGKGPKSGNAKGNAPDQIVAELVPTKRGALEHLLIEALVATNLSELPRAASYASALFRGVPELVAQPERFTTMSLAYLGTVPTAYVDAVKGFGPEGVEWERFGTTISPRLPQGKDLSRASKTFFDALLRGRASMAFEREGKQTSPVTRSLHTRVELEFRK